MLQKIPTAVRDTIYGLTVFLNAMVVIVRTEVKLSIWILGVIGGFNALVALMAKANISEQ